MSTRPRILTGDAIAECNRKAVATKPVLLGDTTIDYLGQEKAYTVLVSSAIGEAYVDVSAVSTDACAYAQMDGVKSRLLIPTDRYHDDIGRIRADMAVHMFQNDGRFDEIATIQAREVVNMLPRGVQNALDGMEEDRHWAAYKILKKAPLRMMLDCYSPTHELGMYRQGFWSAPVMPEVATSYYNIVTEWVGGRPSITLTPFHGIDVHALSPDEYADLAVELSRRGLAVVWSGDRGLEEDIYLSRPTSDRKSVEETWQPLQRLCDSGVVFDGTRWGYEGVTMCGVATDWAAGACTRQNAIYEVTREDSYCSLLHPPPSPSRKNLFSSVTRRNQDGSLRKGYIERMATECTRPEDARRVSIGTHVFISEVA